MSNSDYLVPEKLDLRPDLALLGRLEAEALSSGPLRVVLPCLDRLRPAKSGPGPIVQDLHQAGPASQGPMSKKGELFTFGGGSRREL